MPDSPEYTRAGQQASWQGSAVQSFPPRHRPSSYRTVLNTSFALLTPLTLTLPHRGVSRKQASKQATSNNYQADCSKRLPFSTSATSRGQTLWLSSCPLTGIYQSAALCLRELLPSIPAGLLCLRVSLVFTGNDTAGVWLNIRMPAVVASAALRAQRSPPNNAQCTAVASFPDRAERQTFAHNRDVPGVPGWAFRSLEVTDEYRPIGYLTHQKISVA